MPINERYVRALLENASDVMAVASRDGRFIHIGGASLRVLGYEREAVAGTDLLDYLHPDDRAEAAWRFARRVAEPDAALDLRVFRVRHADGSWRHVEASAHNLLADPDVRGIVINLRDVTDRVEAEQRLRDSEALYQTLARSAPVGIFQTDPEGGIVFANPRFAAITGLPQDALHGRGWRDAVHPDDRARLDTEWTRCTVEGRPMLLDLRFVGPMGVTTSVLCQSSPLTDAEGRLLGCVGTLTDMTEYVRTAEALLMAEARTDAIVDTAADAILTVDDSGMVHSFNRAAEEMFGIPASEIRWQKIDRLLPAPDGGPSMDLLRAVLPDGAAPAVGKGHDIVAMRADGTRFPAELSVSAIEGGGRRMFTGIIRDITERKRIEQELIRAKEAAESADKAKSAFLQIMSHELRTPLNAVIGFSQVIEMRLLGAAEVDRYTEYATSIRQSGEHLLGIIDDILDITKIEAGNLDLTDGPVDLTDLVGQGLNLVAIQAGKRGVAVSIDLPDGMPMLWGDAQRLRQVLVNLLSNAVKFSKAGDTVTVGARQDGEGGAALFVRDTGIGMAPEDIPKALTPFTQVDQSMTRGYEGTGLGLPISKRLVEAHGGALHIDSAPGQGTTVTVRLPAERVMSMADYLRAMGV
ncbi:PAS domain S-box protein [Azospirillum sp. sgz302134]